MYAKYKLIKIYDTESLHHFTNVTRNTVIVYIYENYAADAPLIQIWPISFQSCILYRNQSFHLQCISNDLFVYEMQD